MFNHMNAFKAKPPECRLAVPEHLPSWEEARAVKSSRRFKSWCSVDDSNISHLIGMDQEPAGADLVVLPRTDANPW